MWSIYAESSTLALHVEVESFYNVPAGVRVLATVLQIQTPNASARFPLIVPRRFRGRTLIHVVCQHLRFTRSLDKIRQLMSKCICTGSSRPLKGPCCVTVIAPQFYSSTESSVLSSTNCDSFLSAQLARIDPALKDEVFKVRDNLLHCI